MRYIIGILGILLGTSDLNPPNHTEIRVETQPVNREIRAIQDSYKLIDLTHRVEIKQNMDIYQQ